MWLPPLDKTVAVQEMALGLEQIVDRPIAGEDLFGVAQIVQGDCRDCEVEGAANPLWPRWVDEVAEDVAKLIRLAGQTLTGAVEHRPGIILQRDASRREGMQHLFAD